MKLALSGALLLGTVDGANVGKYDVGQCLSQYADPLTEIAEDAGEENVSPSDLPVDRFLTFQCFLFGHLADQVDQVRWDNSYKPTSLAERSPEVRFYFRFLASRPLTRFSSSQRRSRPSSRACLEMATSTRHCSRPSTSTITTLYVNLKSGKR